MTGPDSLSSAPVCVCGHPHEMDVGCGFCSCELWTRPKVTPSLFASRYRKRPVEVDAIRFAEDASNWRECCRFLGDETNYQDDEDLPPFLDVHTLHGATECLPGEWIVRGQQGDHWPVRDDIFRETYEVAS